MAPTIQWINPCGASITAESNPSITETVNDQVYTSYLQFMPLRTSHGGIYTCIARVSIPGVIPVQTTETTNIVVQSKSIIIVGIPPPPPFAELLDAVIIIITLLGAKICIKGYAPCIKLSFH